MSTFKTSVSDQQSRDFLRRQACKQHEITLIEVPYWWNGKEGALIFAVKYLESLIASILQHRPQLIHFMNVK